MVTKNLSKKLKTTHHTGTDNLTKFNNGTIKYYRLWCLALNQATSINLYVKYFITLYWQKKLIASIYTLTMALQYNSLNIFYFYLVSFVFNLHSCCYSFGQRKVFMHHDCFPSKYQELFKSCSETHRRRWVPVLSTHPFHMVDSPTTQPSLRVLNIISANSPGYRGTDLPFSCTGHQISQIK